MKGIKYLFFTTLKNNIKELFKNPAKLVSALLMIFAFAVVILSSVFSRAVEGAIEFRNISELTALIFVLYFGVFLYTSSRGFTTGATFFSMADVNILFNTPVSSKKILIYGLIKQMGMTLMIGLVIFFQYGWISTIYNIDFLQMIFIMLGYCIVFFMGQLVSMAIYSCGSDKLKSGIKYAFYGVTALLFVYAAINVVTRDYSNIENIIKTLTETGNSVLFRIVPVGGWCSAFVSGIITGNITLILLGIGAVVISIAGLLFYMMKSKGDYYEDVIKATEISQNAITMKKEGKVGEVIPKNIRVGKTGLDKGKGASAFFYKHLLENRRSKIFIFDGMTLVFMAIIIVFSVIMSHEEGNGAFVGIYVFSVYMQFFNVCLGRWAKELVKPYVYMVPQSAFKKLIMISLENVIKIVYESLVLFIILGFILKLSPLTFICAVVSRISFGLIFMAGNFVTERIMGSVSSKMLVILVYGVVIFTIIAPGAVIGILLGLSNPGFTTVTVLLTMAVWNTAASAVTAFLCRNILNYAELNNK